MPLPGNKAITPFKTMDIKTALLSGGSRKRKAPSPVKSKSEPKSIKLSTENSDHEGDIEILDEACSLTIALQAAELDPNLGDCKENKDINATKVDPPVSDCKENKLNSVKDNAIPSVNKSPKLETRTSENDSDKDAELLNEKAKNSGYSSCDELNNSENVSLNTSGLSVTCEDENGDDEEDNLSSKIDEQCSNNDGENATKKDMKEKVKKKKMTPAEAQKRAEEREMKQKEKLEKKQQLEDKRRERMLEKERKLKEKMVKKEREEMEKKERERIKQEKKEQEEKERLQKQKEKEEKLKIKQMLIEQKLEEKKKKEEMRLKKEEELKRVEEEKMKAKLEKERKEKERQERTKAAFVKFFVRGDSSTSAPPVQAIEKEGAFLPFQVSDDMTLAPVVPLAAQERFNKKQLDHYLECQDGKELYLQILKSGSYKDVRQRKKNRKLDANDDVIVIDENAQTELGLCPKLLQFHENVRPPYWGTWRKKSKNIRPRNPFGEEETLDYSVDSDDEWDEGGPGESLSGTEAEDESEDDYEVDNEFFVPHGYLSDEEEKKEDDDEEVNDPEKQKALLKLKLQEFETERKKKTTELKPIILGCYFVNNPAFRDNGLQMFLQAFAAEMLSDSPIPTNFSIKKQQAISGNNKAESPKSSSSNPAKKKIILPVPDEAFPPLIRLVHGNVKNRRVLAEEFQKFWIEQSSENQEVKNKVEKSVDGITETDPSKEMSVEQPNDTAQISLKQLKQTIREIASYGKPPDSTFNKCCWWVHDAIREKYGLVDAPVPNQWKYVSQKDSEPPVKVNSASIKVFLSAN